MANKDVEDESIPVLVKKLRKEFNDILLEPIPNEIEELLKELEEASDKESSYNTEAPK